MKAGFLAFLLTLAGCAFQPPPAVVPLPVLRFPAESNPSRCLIVLLPGRGDGPADFERHGFVAIAREKRVPCDLLAVDSHLGYFADKSIVTRLAEDVLQPAKSRGYREIWLAGISLGGLGSLLTVRQHAGEIAGVLLLAPYLGEAETIAEIEGAGGLAAWPAPPVQETAEVLDFPRGLWSWLRRNLIEEEGKTLPPIYLGAGRSDRFAAAHRLLARSLPPERVLSAPGGHTWRAWRELWSGFLDLRPFAR